MEGCLKRRLGQRRQSHVRLQNPIQTQRRQPIAGFVPVGVALELEAIRGIVSCVLIVLRVMGAKTIVEADRCDVFFP